jgi:AraC-like DNA-binding protein
MLSILYSATSGGILLLAFLILTNPRKVNQSGNRWLAFFLFALFFMLIDSALTEGDVYNQFPHLRGLDGFLIFATAPALYFCVSYYIEPLKRFKSTDYLHFSLAFLLFPILLLDVFISKAEKLKHVNEARQQSTEPDFFIYLIWFQMMIYLSISLLKLRKHRKNIEVFASDTAAINLNWLNNFLIGLGLMLLLWVFESFNKTIFTSLLSVTGYFMAVFALGYFALRQEEIFPFEDAAITEINEIIEQAILSTPKQRRIPEEELTQLKEKLTFLMTSEKPYLDETLGLPKLAEKMGISAHNLSFLLNEGFNANFFQFVNRYRIEEAKIILVSPKHQHLSMIGIAFECGFSSKTTFNITFKKMTGVSPSAFIANFAKEDSAT